MTTTVFRVRSGELPKPWAERVGAFHDTEVEVTLSTNEQQTETLKSRLKRSLAEANQRITVDTFKIENDPIFSMGQNPIESDVTDASINHDKYLYQG